MKKLQNLVGVKTLSKKEQQAVKGGGIRCYVDCIGKCTGYKCIPAKANMHDQ